ncbi:MAG: GNAT family N-acetyltransferase [Candidatus Aminicenantes bacterium]|nr:GNAT family N-acetyltransferase [Candidatus Aminicenantes bacterium]
MLIRNARTSDIPAIRKLAVSLGLDYPGMEEDRIWVAEGSGRLWGMVALLVHPDCLELVALGVDPGARSAGLGGRLIETLMAAAAGDVYLATVIPDYFERHGFALTVRAPNGMAKDPTWCEGCSKESCTVMVRTKK